MRVTLTVMKHGFFDLFRSRWLPIYTLFFFAVTGGLLYFGTDVSQVLLSTLNLLLMVVPLVSLVLGLGYYYYTRDYIEIILSQPVSRPAVFLGHYLGFALPLVGSFILGSGLPFVVYGVGRELAWPTVLTLLFTGTLVSLIFAALAFLIGLSNEERVRGLSAALAVWLAFSLLYDALLLVFITLMQAYPIETALIGLSLANPLDLSRILVLLQLDAAALMGYTGAVFQRFFGTPWGVVISTGSLLLWLLLSISSTLATFRRKDF